MISFDSGHQEGFNDVIFGLGIDGWVGVCQVDELVWKAFPDRIVDCMSKGRKAAFGSMVQLWPLRTLKVNTNLSPCFPHFPVHTKHLGILLTCRSGVVLQFCISNKLPEGPCAMLWVKGSNTVNYCLLKLGRLVGATLEQDEEQICLMPGAS